MTASAAAVAARHLSLVGPEGPVFTDVSLDLPAGRLTVLVGPSGSGRSSLLLALCGRMRGTTGLLVHSRHVRTRRDLRALQQATSVARAGTFVAPEPRLTVGQSVAERALLDGVRTALAASAFAAAEELLEVRLDRHVAVERLTAYEQAALAVALALVRPADLVVLDDVDADLSLDDQRRLLDGLARVAADGPAVLASTTESAPVPADALLVTLAPPTEVR